MSAYIRGVGGTSSWAGGTSMVVTVPSYAQNDLLVALIRCAPGTITPPGGWTHISAASAVAPTYQLQWYRRIAGASEPSSYTWTIPNTTSENGQAETVSIPEVDTSNPIADASASELGYCGVTPAVSTSVESGMLLFGNGSPSYYNLNYPRDAYDPGALNFLLCAPFDSAPEASRRRALWGGSPGYVSTVVVASALPIITPSISTAALGRANAGAAGTTEAQWTVSGSGMGAKNLVIIPKGGVEVKNVTAGGSYSRSPLVLTPSGGSLSSTTLKIRFGADTPPGRSFPDLVMYCGIAKQTIAITGQVDVAPTQFPLRSVHPVAIAGARLDAYLGFLDEDSGGHQSLPNDNYHVWIDTYDIDQVVSPETGQGRQPGISARQLAGKWLRQTTSLQDYQLLGQVKHYDDFDQLDHVVIVSGDWAVANGKLTNTHSGGAGISEKQLVLLTGENGVDSGLSDLCISANFSLSAVSADTAAGFVFFYTDSNNYWYCEYTDSGGAVLAQIYRVAAGVATLKYQETSFGVLSASMLSPGNHRFAFRIQGTRAYIFDRDYAITLPGVSSADLERPIGLFARTKNAGETVSFSDVRAFSLDGDLSEEWCVARVCALAGLGKAGRESVLDVSAVSVDPEYWTDMIDVDNLDMTVEIPPDFWTGNDNGREIAVHLWASEQSAANFAGIKVVLTRESAAIYLPDSTIAVDPETWYLQRYGVVAHRLRITHSDSFVSVWVDGRFMGGATVGSVSTRGYIGFVASASQVLDLIRIVSFSERRDGLIFDMGSPMSSALEQVIEDRGILVSPVGQTIRYSKFDTRDNLGAWTAGIYQDQSGPNDADAISLVRATGIEIAEAINEEMARKYGIRLAQIQTSQSRTIDDILDRAERTLRQTKSNINYHTLSGVPILSAEPEDKIAVSYDSTDGEFSMQAQAIINDVSFSYAPGTLGMTINTREDPEQ